MKVLVLNEGYSDNFGDQAIKKSIEYLLINNNIRNITFADFTKDLHSKIQYRNLHTAKKSLLKKILVLIIPKRLIWLLKNVYRIETIASKKYDLVIIGGGQLLLSNQSFPLALLTWVKYLKSRNNHNIVLFSVGAGIKFSLIDKKFLELAINKINKIYVRDCKSQQIVKNIFDKNSLFVDDVAFLYSKISSYEQKKGGNDNLTLLGIVSFNVYKRYNQKKITKEEYFQTWLDILDKKNISIDNIKLFYTTINDRVECFNFKKYIKSTFNKDILICNVNSLEDLIDIIKSSNLVISGRMHALILALSYHKQIYTYLISDKLIEFNRLYGNKIKLNEIQDNIEMQFRGILK